MPQPTLRVRLKTVAESVVRQGHPWVFDGSIREQNRPGETGELAVIYDRNDQFLAIGLFDADSPIRIRILHCGKPVKITAQWWTERLQTALDRRVGLFANETNGYRIINGESDSWPGLVFDRYDGVFVLKIYTAAWLPRLGELIEVFRSKWATNTIVLRLSRNILSVSREHGFEDGQTLSGPSFSNPVIFSENGIRFEADVIQGQKTGFFLDQRENRSAVEKLSQGRRVLNAFSFSGGFSLYAARGGANSVTDLDISAHALESAVRNFGLNQADPNIAKAVHRQIKADAFEWLASNKAEQFDLIVLDPPSLAKKESDRPVALGAYEKLAAAAITHLRDGGILVAASCSAHVQEAAFFAALTAAATASGRQYERIKLTGHAPDHPSTFPESRYLKCIFLRF
jgi:23S rRNA (cytosine1962-C5)-methyltransferase